MSASNAKKLSNLFRLAVKPNTPELNSSPLASSISRDRSSKLKYEFHLSDLKLDSSSNSENSQNVMSTHITSLLCDGQSVKSPDSLETDDAKNVMDLPWMLNISHGNTSLLRKEVTRERKQKYISKSTQGNTFIRLAKVCADKLGTGATIEVFGKLGHETGVKEFNSLIRICIDDARATDDADVAIEHISNAFHLFRKMREHGFQLEEQTYSPVLLCMIDMGMVEEFYYVCDFLKDESPNSVSRLGYYVMKLWLRVDNAEMIQEICNYISDVDGEDINNLRESCILALCESDRKKELLELLEIIDITKISSAKSVACIFQSLGRLLLESLTEKLLLALKTCDREADNITNLIAAYAVSIPNLGVEDVISKFKYLHQKLEVSPSSSSYEKLISYCCDIVEVYVALDIVDEMCEAGFTLATEVLHSILQISEETREYNLVHRIYAIIRRYNLESTVETFRFMINLCMKMKDFEGAYNLLDDLEEMNLKPIPGIYNAIMAGYFREKNISGGLRVLKRMQCDNVKPDSHTFSYLISNSETEEDIIKYYEELMESKIQPTKQVFMALINAYAARGQLEKAKQVVLDSAIPAKSLNEIKSVLVSALASHGQLSEALLVCEEIKNAGHSLEPKAVISLIEQTQSNGELHKSLQLLKELHDPDYWTDGCCRIILYCVRSKNLSSAVDLCKQLKDKFHSDELVMDALFDEVFSQIAELGSTHLQLGLALLWVIKDELGFLPSRKCLDFLLSACVNAKDLLNAHLIWREYEVAGLPYNVLSYLRMYQALLASGDHKSAKIMLKKIPEDDPHVCSVIKACQKTYGHRTSECKKKL